MLSSPEVEENVESTTNASVYCINLASPKLLSDNNDTDEVWAFPCYLGQDCKTVVVLSNNASATSRRSGRLDGVRHVARQHTEHE